MTSTADTLLFGTAGIPLSTPVTSTLAAIGHTAKIGLDCLEIECVRGVKMGRDTAEKIRERATSTKTGLSLHAPYYINLNSPEHGKRLASKERLLNSARIGELCGARSLVFHGGYYGTSSPEKTYDTIKQEITEVVSILKMERNPVTLRLETMGKKSQFGTLEEVLLLCRETDGLQPCLDFSHIHAREGKVNSYLDFHRVLRKVEKKLGRAALDNLHVHISGVEYNRIGELRHLNLLESDFHFDDWIQALKDFDVGGMVICESPNLEADALMLKKLYFLQPGSFAREKNFRYP